ncbi:hypothetical protein RJ639_043890 [Escallonia herrerae]|uniref:Translation initiation factor eIF2B subunit epsilon n=1 Tax=Escallonia herrerae TaxID=1293975 RepID=A0AA88W9T8_9ASTE|nr:hypothetical protein RJ639_043890 [Escallonia herrerae]
MTQNLGSKGVCVSLTNLCNHQVGNGGVGFIWSVSEGGHDEEWRQSIAPIPADKLIEVAQATNDDLDRFTQDGHVLPPSGELEPGSTMNGSDSDEIDRIREDSAYFEKEVEATFLRAVNENIKEDHVILEVNSLRLSYNLTSEDCAGALFYSMMKLALDVPHSSANELVKNVGDVITTWQKLLGYYLPSIDEEIEVIMKFEEMCLESAKEYSSVFVQILHLLYEKDIIKEEAILSWAAEKEGADESDKVFVKQSEKFIQWLNEASEEED